MKANTVYTRSVHLPKLSGLFSTPVNLFASVPFFFLAYIERRDKSLARKKKAGGKLINGVRGEITQLR